MRCWYCDGVAIGLAEVDVIYSEHSGDLLNGGHSNTVTATAPAAPAARALQAVGNGAIGNSNTAIVLAAADIAAANCAKANSNTITAAAIGDVANGANGNTVTA